MNVLIILIIWGIIDILATCYVVSLAAAYGPETAQRLMNMGFVLFNLVYWIVAIILLWESNVWFVPFVFHHLVIAPTIRLIYKV